MPTSVILFNPIAGEGAGEARAHRLEALPRFHDRTLDYRNVLELRDPAALLRELSPERGDEIVLCGGDGTLNHFVNEIYGLPLTVPLLLYAIGSGNDFARDLGKGEEGEPFPVNDYITDLPTVTVKGKTCRFLNGIGFGIDGYCCEIGDRCRERGKRANYTAIAIKGLLFAYHASAASVTVDGETRRYDRAWIAPTMFGRYYGGGMMPTPAQDRKSKARTVSQAIIYGAGKLKTLTVFPSIFSGGHVKHTEMVDIRAGHRVKVTFDQPAPLQIDGETVTNVTSYEVTSGAT